MVPIIDDRDSCIGSVGGETVLALARVLSEHHYLCATSRAQGCQLSLAKVLSATTGQSVITRSVGQGVLFRVLYAFAEGRGGEGRGGGGAELIHYQFFFLEKLLRGCKYRRETWHVSYHLSIVRFHPEIQRNVINS